VQPGALELQRALSAVILGPPDGYTPSVSRWALLDRDGTIIVNHGYLVDPERVELIPGAGEAIRALRGLGLSIGIVTNQSVVALGLTDEAGVARVNRRMLDLLEAEGAAVDALVHCPHVAADGCACRKPATGLVDRLVAEHGLDPRTSFVVGDDWKDIELGRRVGATTILVRTGHGRTIEQDGTHRPDHVADDLRAASRAIAAILAANPA
jgi:histidinol-phosphate phosphatase family protein